MAKADRSFIGYPRCRASETRTRRPWRIARWGRVEASPSPCRVRRSSRTMYAGTDRLDVTALPPGVNAGQAESRSRPQDCRWREVRRPQVTRRHGLRWSIWPASCVAPIQIAGRSRYGRLVPLLQAWIRRVYRQALRSCGRGLDARRVGAWHGTRHIYSSSNH